MNMQWKQTLSRTLVVLVLLLVVASNNVGTRGLAQAQKTKIKSPVNVGTWETITSPTTTPLNGLSMLSSTDGWAIGANQTIGQPKNSTILHWDGNSWISVTSPTTTDILSDIDMLTPTDGWLVGTCRIYHWDGSSWTQVSSPTCNYISAVDMVSSNDVWAVGFGAILHWDGVNWTILYAPSDPWLQDLDMISSTDGWAVGFNGKIYHWNGTNWSIMNSPTTNHLFAVDMVSATDGWAIGSNGTIIHWNGSSWTVVTSPTTNSLSDIAMVSSKDGWIVGRDILHWDGNTWSIVTNPTTEGLNAVAMVSATEGWAVGWNGVILQYTGPSASLSINYSSGSPGSFFTITGTNFPSDNLANISVNGQSLGTIQTDVSGNLTFLLDTSQSDEGYYFINASVNANSSSTIGFILDSSKPLWPQEGTGAIFDIPSGIAYTNVIYLPLVQR